MTSRHHHRGYLVLRTPSGGGVARGPAGQLPLGAAPGSNSARQRRRWYVPVRWKFAFALAAAIAWMILSIVLARGWQAQLGEVVGDTAAWLIIGGIAVVPGFMNAFLIASLLVDRRPPARELPQSLPGISILVAAYNEADNILGTLESIDRQRYPGPLQVIVVDDGSTDATAQRLAEVR